MSLATNFNILTRENARILVLKSESRFSREFQKVILVSTLHVTHYPSRNLTDHSNHKIIFVSKPIVRKSVSDIGTSNVMEGYE